LANATYKLFSALCLLLWLTTATAQITERPQTSSDAEDSPARFALKTNLLYDAVIVPNIGLEVALFNHYSVSVDWMYTWFKNDSRHRYWQCYGGYLTVRRSAQGDRPPVLLCYYVIMPLC
jgi:hypothetical protein